MTAVSLRSARVLAAVTVAVALFSSYGCRSTETGPTPTPSSANIPFLVVDLVVGTGDVAAVGDVLLVDFSGWLYDARNVDQKGALFDTSVDDLNPFTFTLGAGQVIEGWDMGLPGVAVGGIRRLEVPPALGFGSAGSGPIPPDAGLVFEVLLQGILPPA